MPVCGYCFSLTLLLFSLFVSGCGGGASPKPKMKLYPFTADVACPVDGVDFISGSLEIDLTGVDIVEWPETFSFSEKNNEIIRATLENCDNPVPSDIYCNGSVNDVASVVFYKRSEELYSNKLYLARYVDLDMLDAQVSNEQRYPVVKDGTGQMLEVNDQNFTDELKGDSVNVLHENTTKEIDITYTIWQVDDLTYTIKISDADGNVLASKSTNSVSTTVPGTTKKLKVSYEIQNACSKSTDISFTADDEDESTTEIIVIIIAVIVVVVILIVIVAICFFVFRNRITVQCSSGASIDDLESLVKQHPKVLKQNEKNPIYVYVFHHEKTSGSQPLKQDKLLRDLAGKQATLTDQVGVVMKMKVEDDSVLKLYIKDIKNVKDATKGDIEMNGTEKDKMKEEDVKDGDGGAEVNFRPLPKAKQTMFRSQPLPAIGSGLGGGGDNSNDVRKMKRKEKRDKDSSDSTTSLVPNDTNNMTIINITAKNGKNTSKKNSFDATDGGRHSPGRPFNDTRVHPASDDEGVLDSGSGGGERNSGVSVDRRSGGSSSGADRRGGGGDRRSNDSSVIGERNSGGGRSGGYDRRNGGSGGDDRRSGGSSVIGERNSGGSDYNNINTSHTQPHALTTNFPTDSNSNPPAPRRLEPLGHKTSPSPRPLPRPKNDYVGTPL